MSEALDIRNSNDAYSVALDKIDIANPDRFRDNTIWPYFERLRKEDPVHYTAESVHGPFWSITKFEDIMFVDTHHDLFSSEGGITIDDEDVEFELPMFIAMDPPKHDLQRKTVSGVVAPPNLAKTRRHHPRTRRPAFSIRCRRTKRSTGSTRFRSN